MKSLRVEGKCKFCGAEALSVSHHEGAFMFSKKHGMGIENAALTYCRKCDKIQSEQKYWSEMPDSSLKEFFKKNGVVRA